MVRQSSHSIQTFSELRQSNKSGRPSRVARPFAQALEDIETIRIDLPGTGKSPLPTIPYWPSGLATLLTHAPDRLDWLWSLRPETLVRSGTDDLIVPAANGWLMSRLIPNGRLHISKDGHLGVLTSTDELASRSCMISCMRTANNAYPSGIMGIIRRAVAAL